MCSHHHSQNGKRKRQTLLWLADRSSAPSSLSFSSRIRPNNTLQELDFLNEANNQIRMKRVLSEMEGTIIVPDVMLDLSTRRVLVSEWVEGRKLTQAEPAEVRRPSPFFGSLFLQPSQRFVDVPNRIDACCELTTIPLLQQCHEQL